MEYPHDIKERQNRIVNLAIIAFIITLALGLQVFFG